MDLLYVRGHVGESSRRNLPVAAERIAPVRVVSLPSVVENDCLHAHLRGDCALFLDLICEHILVKLVPCRIKRIVRRLGYAARRQFRGT